MYLLAKLGALGIVIWFYYTANEKKQSPFNWVITGLVGYALVWGLFYSAMSALLPVKTSGEFWMHQIPAIAAIISSIFVRNKLISMADKQAS